MPGLRTGPPCQSPHVADWRRKMQSESRHGRPKKLGPPPRASTYRTPEYAYLRPDDLATLARAAGVPVVADEKTQHREIHRINGALNHFVLFESDTEAKHRKSAIDARP